MGLRANYIEKRHRRKGDKMKMAAISFAGTLVIFLLGLAVNLLQHNNETSLIMAKEQIKTNETLKYVIENQTKNEGRINSNILELKSLDHRVLRVETDVDYLKKNTSKRN